MGVTVLVGSISAVSRAGSFSRTAAGNRAYRTRFSSRTAENAHQMHFLRFLREDWGEFQNRMYVKGGRKY